MENNNNTSNYNGTNQDGQPFYTNIPQENQPNYGNTPQYNQANYGNNAYANNNTFANNTYANNTYTSNPYNGNATGAPNDTYYQDPNAQYYNINNGYNEPPKSNGLAIASLVLGIISIPMACCYGAGLVFGIIALILGLVSKPKTGPGAGRLPGMAIGGIICGIIGALMSIAMIVYLAYIISEYGDLDELFREFGYY